MEDPQPELSEKNLLGVPLESKTTQSTTLALRSHGESFALSSFSAPFDTAAKPRPGRFDKERPTFKKPWKKLRASSNCYTCNPRGKTRSHIISSDSGFTFHHDMVRRPLVLVTPEEHVVSLTDLSSERQLRLFEVIGSFCEFWAIRDYQISFSFGTWQKHPHFHAKIKFPEVMANRMRRDHFKRLKLEKKYEPATSRATEGKVMEIAVNRGYFSS
jgi:hypothetical protein